MTETIESKMKPTQTKQTSKLSFKRTMSKLDHFSSNEDESSGGEDEHEENDILGEDDEDGKELCIQVKLGKEEAKPFLDR